MCNNTLLVVTHFKNARTSRERKNAYLSHVLNSVGEFVARLDDGGEKHGGDLFELGDGLLKPLLNLLIFQGGLGCHVIGHARNLKLLLTKQLVYELKLTMGTSLPVHCYTPWNSEKREKYCN